MDAGHQIQPVPFSRAGDGSLRLAVVGGTTPFLCEFVAACGATDPDPVRWDLRLLGRDPASIIAMTAFASAVVPGPHRVLVTADPALALDGADVVLAQPRVGGFAGRAMDEDLAAASGAPADEGLGPGGLRAALRMTPVLRGLAADTASRAPEALMLGFSNPLSTTVSILTAAGLRSVGTCELPGVTADEVANRLQVPSAELDWTFVGMNHRGFLYDLAVHGTPVWQRMLTTLRESTAPHIGGIDVETIEQVGAVPLKYHAMLSGAARPRSGRARQLQQIRDEALDELRQYPDRLPTALAGRAMPWYRQAVTPVLLALAGALPAQQFVLDIAGRDGLVRETACRVDGAGVHPGSTDASHTPLAAAVWIATFEAHERAVEALLADPSSATLEWALRLDPATPDTAVDMLSRELAPSVRALRDEPIRADWVRG